MSISFKKIIFVKLISTLLLIGFAATAYCWDGYDIERNVRVYIGSGNLVREGNTIRLFDYGINDYRYVEIITMNSSFNGTVLNCRDVNSKDEMALQMNEE